MNNLYLIITTDKITLDRKLEKIKQNFTDAEVVHYDLYETPIQTIIEDLDTYNFLSKRKIIIGHNANFLSTEKKKLIVEHNIEKLEKYIENPNPENVLILTTENIDKRKKIVSKLLKSSDVTEIKIDIKDAIKSSLTNYKINTKTVNLLIEYCINDNERILNEIEKLKLYKIESKEILEEDVEKIVVKNLDDNIFNLIDSILNGNKKYAFELYQNLVLHGEQTTSIINVLANKIRLIYQVKILSQNNNDKEISRLLKTHEYPIKLARNVTHKYKESTLLNYLDKLAELDYQLKSGQTTMTDNLFQIFIARI